MWSVQPHPLAFRLHAAASKCISVQMIYPCIDPLAEYLTAQHGTAQLSVVLHHVGSSGKFTVPSTPALDTLFAPLQGAAQPLSRGTRGPRFDTGYPVQRLTHRDGVAACTVLRCLPTGRTHWLALGHTVSYFRVVGGLHTWGDFAAKARCTCRIQPLSGLVTVQGQGRTPHTKRNGHQSASLWGCLTSWLVGKTDCRIASPCLLLTNLYCCSSSCTGASWTPRLGNSVQTTPPC